MAYRGHNIAWRNTPARLMKIMMIEDSEASPELCRILLDQLHGPGLEIFESNAADGLKTYRSIEPDCVLLKHEARTAFRLSLPER
jgi:hypothetical protein